MGSYVVYCNHAKRERIEPGELDHGAMKTNPVAYRADLGRLLIHMLSYGYPNQWDSIEQNVDSYPNQAVHPDTVNEYENVTRKAIESYNKCWAADGTPEEAFKMLYTPES